MYDGLFHVAIIIVKNQEMHNFQQDYLQYTVKTWFQQKYTILRQRDYC